MIGTIVIVHEKPTKAFEIEFSDDHGGTIAQLALTATDIKPA